ncbi:MAG TPA: aldo/keto reductase [Acidobacteriaceae bacterium]|nr:aldo/keto reductase [Acidobacteriaceae bacterium]
MLYARLGKTGLIVSKLAFGAMTFGSSTGPMAAVSKVGQKLADEMVAKVLDAGINFFNTADVYTGGQSEEMLAAALGNRRKDVVIATKVGFRFGSEVTQSGLSRRHIMASAEDSLRRMKTDYIDVYLVHRVDKYTPVEETVSALNDLVRSGKVRYVGFSNWPAWLVAKALGIQKMNAWAEFEAAEMYYSLLSRDIEHEVVPLALDAGIGVMVWSPLTGGFLSGKYSRDKPQGDGGRLTGFDVLPFDREHGYAVVDVLKAIAANHKVSPSQVAIAWLLPRPAISSVLIGANKMEQLEDNLAAANLTLKEDELSKLDEMTKPQPIYPNWFNDNLYDQQAKKALEG